MELIGTSLVAISCLMPAEGVPRNERIPGHVIMTEIQVHTQAGTIYVVGPMCFSGSISNIPRVNINNLLPHNREAVNEVRNR
jgi:hypothetical protein